MAEVRKTPRQIVGGVWDGNMIRRARKAGLCEYTCCRNHIEKGDEYFEGEGDPFKAAGFGVERYCMDHLSEGDTLFFNRETGQTTAPCPEGCAGGDAPESCAVCKGSGIITVDVAVDA